MQEEVHWLLMQQYLIERQNLCFVELLCHVLAYAHHNKYSKRKDSNTDIKRNVKKEGERILITLHNDKMVLRLNEVNSVQLCQEY